MYTQDKNSLPVWIILSPAHHHISINSQPFLVGIVSLVLAVVVSELSKHQCCFLFDCCIFIVRFALLSCYSSAKTRIRPVKLYQINVSFCSITRCALLHIVYHLIAVSTHFWCPELHVHLLSSPRYSFFEPEPEPRPAFESHFRFFNHVFPSRFCMRYYCINPSDLQEHASPI